MVLPKAHSQLPKLFSEANHEEKAPLSPAQEGRHASSFQESLFSCAFFKSVHKLNPHGSFWKLVKK